MPVESTQRGVEPLCLSAPTHSPTHRHSIRRPPSLSGSTADGLRARRAREQAAEELARHRERQMDSDSRSAAPAPSWARESERERQQSAPCTASWTRKGEGRAPAAASWAPQRERGAAAAAAWTRARGLSGTRESWGGRERAAGGWQTWSATGPGCCPACPAWACPFANDRPLGAGAQPRQRTGSSRALQRRHATPRRRGQCCRSAEEQIAIRARQLPAGENGRRGCCEGAAGRGATAAATRARTCCGRIGPSHRTCGRRAGAID